MTMVSFLVREICGRVSGEKGGLLPRYRRGSSWSGLGGEGDSLGDSGSGRGDWCNSLKEGSRTFSLDTMYHHLWYTAQVVVVDIGEFFIEFPNNLSVHCWNAWKMFTLSRYLNESTWRPIEDSQIMYTSDQKVWAKMEFLRQSLSTSSLQQWTLIEWKYHLGADGLTLRI